MGVETAVIKGDPERGRRWIWDKWLFEGNGLWAIARWPCTKRARAEMGGNTWRRRKRDALTHLSNHRGSALFRPVPFCPLLPPICGHFLAAFVPILPQFPVCRPRPAFRNWRK